MRYSGWHLLGTARMGDDPRTSVLDRWNRAHDVANLYVVDGSCFVTSSGVNPTSTIVAIALRAADHMVETRFGTSRCRREQEPESTIWEAGEQRDAPIRAPGRHHFIPAAHGMPSAADVDRRRPARFVLRGPGRPGRPASRRPAPRPARRPAARLDALADEPANLAALQLVIVGGYYTDKRVRELIGYLGQEAIEPDPGIYPPTSRKA